jgi:hypothetical protein
MLLVLTASDPCWDDFGVWTRTTVIYMAYGNLNRVRSTLNFVLNFWRLDYHVLFDMPLIYIALSVLFKHNCRVSAV